MIRGAHRCGISPPPTLNELATWLVARSCLVATIALLLFGVSALSGQPTDEGGNGTSHLTEEVRFVNEKEAFHRLSVNLDGMADAKGSSEPGNCVWCVNSVTEGDVEWHRTTFRFILGWKIGHGEHEWWIPGNCTAVHELCWFWWFSSEAQSLTPQELTRQISDAVAAQDVATLAGYANVPSVVIFAERSAIQIQGCDGETIVGHVPVQPELLAAIEIAAAHLESDG